MKKSSGNTSKKKGGKSTNWFETQAMKAQTPQEALDSANTQPTKTNQPDYKPVAEAPIVKVQAKSKREVEHYEAAYAFAQRMSDPKNDTRMTIHLNMQDELVFNMPEDEHYKALWEKGELMLLVAFPRNWKTMPLSISEEEAEEFDELDTDDGRFDFLYETGMSVFEG